MLLFQYLLPRRCRATFVLAACLLPVAAHASKPGEWTPEGPPGDAWHATVLETLHGPTRRVKVELRQFHTQCAIAPPIGVIGDVAVVDATEQELSRGQEVIVWLEEGDRASLAMPPCWKPVAP